MTAEDVQQRYREYHQNRRGEELTQEDVGNRFASVITTDEAVSVGESALATFELDDRPRIVLAAGDFGTEVTAPVLWLRQEYGIDISCVRLTAYERDGEHLIHGQGTIPAPEAEEFMTTRREKDQQQESARRRSTFDVLTERGVPREGDELLFNTGLLDTNWMPEGLEDRWDPTDDLWSDDATGPADATGKIGQSNNVRWRYDTEEYSFTGLTKAVLREIRGTDNRYFDDAFGYRTHTKFGHKNLTALRDDQVTAHDRRESSTE